MCPKKECESTLFIEIFKVKDPIFKILDFFVDNLGFDYSKTDIAAGAGISRTTLHLMWKTLEETDLVVQTREVGRAKMYKLNLKNPIAQRFLELERAVADYYAPSSCDAPQIEEAPERTLIYS
ncbi:MAG TPA: winged helix-turn-helix domain-containing protein [Methanothrix sp.]|nr:winged helix-turn-helix domain-containing protein [Methanothrix sp.]